MKVLMLGWELPPLYAGGIGMVCYEIIKELAARPIPVTYIMPMGPPGGMNSPYANLIIAENHLFKKKIIPKIIGLPAFFQAYQSPEEYEKAYEEFLLYGKKRNRTRSELYGKSLFIEVDLFAKRLYNIVNELDFDVIHAHDWMTFPAAIGIADKTGKPLVIHVHNTIYDRYLGNASKHERDIEYNGLARADRIIAISHYVKNMIIDKYGINPNKIEVIHNAKNTYMKQGNIKYQINIQNKKVVLFAGRITVQKGPEYFLYAAKKVLEKRKDVLFIMAGSGDMLNRMIQLAAQLGIAKYMIFTGRYNMEQAPALYRAADCFVMPSVSEPFGIVPLEAMANMAPCIISKQSGCAEVLGHVLKVDFWDTYEMANKILSILSYNKLKTQLKNYGKIEVENLTWDKSVDKILGVYDLIINMKK
jgi:glycosyltransferase involved in cell wall biosynthesis